MKNIYSFIVCFPPKKQGAQARQEQLKHYETKKEYLMKSTLLGWLLLFILSLLSDSNQRPRDYKSRALAN